MHVDLVYNADLFDAGANGGPASAQLEALLEQALDRPAEPVGALTLWSPPPRRAVLPDPSAELSATWEGAGRTRSSRARPAGPRVPSPWPIPSSPGPTATSMSVQAGSPRSFRPEACGPGTWWPSGLTAARRWSGASWGCSRRGPPSLMLDPRYPAPRQAQMLEIARPAAWLRVAAAGPVPVEIESALDALGGLRGTCRLTLPARAEDSRFLADILADIPAEPLATEVGPDDLGLRGIHLRLDGRAQGRARPPRLAVALHPVAPRPLRSVGRRPLQPAFRSGARPAAPRPLHAAPDRRRGRHPRPGDDGRARPARRLDAGDRGDRRASHAGPRDRC